MVLLQTKISMMLRRFGQKHNKQMYLYQADVIRKNLLKKGSSYMTKVQECVHNCLNNSMFVSMMGGTIAFILTLVLGSYGYTWGESKADGEEKAQWRAQHERLLERKFEEVRQGQEKLKDSFERTNTDMKELLKQILEEQRRSNHNQGGSPYSPRRG